MVKISAVLITYNEEANIGRCIDSLKDVVDEVVMVDSFSTDNTEAIALSRGARIIKRKFTDFSDQKKFSVGEATHDHVLALDADEFLSAELRESILKVKANWTADGYRVSRLSSFKGKWIRTCGWYPEKKIRLWDRRAGNWSTDTVHEKVEMNAGASEQWIAGDLLHEAYHSVTEIQRKNLYYSGFYANENRFRIKSSLFKIFYKTVFAFFRSYILQKGFRQGFAGFIISGSNSGWTFYKYAKLYEANHYLNISLVIHPQPDLSNLEAILKGIVAQTEFPREIIIASPSTSKALTDVVQEAQFKIPAPIFTYALSSAECAERARGELVIPIENASTINRTFIRDSRKAFIKKSFAEKQK